ncbi:hypothetical protein V491_04667 [Pseudogymnoascus sp. VKM F-3775]|nr:hypothetical protein V491_04667 [Pseudogymnoascus sp. VKM F-3775]
MARTRRFLITGATGKQGGAIVNSLVECRANLPSNEKFEALCLTRNTTSEKAVALASNEGVSAIAGNLFFPLSAFDKFGPIDAVFRMTCPGDLGDEESKPLPSSTPASPTGSSTLSLRAWTVVSKYNAEEYLKAKCAESHMTWTILRLAGFMDNLMPNFTGKRFAAIWAQIGEKPLQLVSVKDIAHFGAIALLQPEEYAGRAIGLAGDELNFVKAQKVFRHTMGYEMPRAWTFVASLIAFALPEMGQMFKWLREEGYGVDIEGLKEEYPEL